MKYTCEIDIDLPRDRVIGMFRKETMKQMVSFKSFAESHT